MWQKALAEWIGASRAAQENTKLLLADPALNTEECTRRMLRLDDAQCDLEEYADEPDLPVQVKQYLGANMAYNSYSHPACTLNASGKLCEKCQKLSDEFFGSRDWLREHGEELLRS